MSDDEKTSASDVPRDDSPTGAGAESVEEGAAARDDADDAVIDVPASGANTAE